MANKESLNMFAAAQERDREEKAAAERANVSDGTGNAKAKQETDRFTFDVDLDRGMKLREYALRHRMKLTDVFREMIDDLPDK